MIKKAAFSAKKLTFFLNFQCSNIDIFELLQNAIKCNKIGKSIKSDYVFAYIDYTHIIGDNMQITKQNDIITIDNVDFMQSKSWPKYYVSKLGSYVTVTKYRY